MAIKNTNIVKNAKRFSRFLNFPLSRLLTCAISGLIQGLLTLLPTYSLTFSSFIPSRPLFPTRASILRSALSTQSSTLSFFTRSLSHFHTCSPAPQKGFTLVEMLVTLFIIGIMGTVAGGIYLSSEEAKGYEATAEIMNEIKAAILGQYTPRIRGQCISGYVADMGNLPPLDENGQPVSLWQRGKLPARRYDEAARIHVGWDGPYIEAPESGFLTDGWGGGILFQRQGKGLVITSYGSDGKLGGHGYARDIVMSIEQTHYMAPVGWALTPDAGDAVVNYPEQGILRSMSIESIGGNQFMSRENAVPIGLRSVSTTIDGEERCFVFSVAPTVNWLGKLK
jgi:prepilin-type N-terminal cleavage/methylation domain-containing protein